MFEDRPNHCSFIVEATGRWCSRRPEEAPHQWLPDENFYMRQHHVAYLVHTLGLALCWQHRNQLIEQIALCVDIVIESTVASRARQSNAKPRRRTQSSREQSCIYFLRRERDGRIKIGTTIDLDRRIGELSRDNGPLSPLLVLRGSFQGEKEIHYRFQDDRVGRSEWFAASDRLLRWISQPNIDADLRSLGVRELDAV